MQYRTEEDLLGSMDVPAEAYYGIHTVRALENFQISNERIQDNQEFVKGMVLAKKAAALANGELGTIDPTVAEAIVKACDVILETGKCMDQFPVDVFQGGAGTSVNMNTNEVLANLALELMGHEKGHYEIVNPNDDVNRCQSTNDAYPTGFRVALFNSTGNLLWSLEKLVAVIEVKSKEFADVLKMGRTQLQDAVPMTLGQEFRAYAVTLREELKNIHRCRELLLEVNLGATAIGTGINTPSEYSALAVRKLAEVTGQPYMQAADLVEATSDCGAYVMLSGAVKRMAVKMSKICNDLRLLSSGPRAGLNEINLPERQAGSSIMPAKVNPVIPEVVNQICFKVVGNDITITMAAEAGQLQLNVMEPVISQSLFESMHLLERGCETLMDKCIVGITANRDVCEKQVFDSIGIVTFLNPFIGHHEGDIVGQICAQTGRSVRDVVLERNLLSKVELDEIFSVENMKAPQYRGKRFEVSVQARA
ncbi:aspartate ammonia-lyase [Sansalvadorimonas sp. 2012CJ34-2]|uniref:Aspartate ammonia-lyase n=1 Tax=Parendozoicomonas callyspongiae TaxID=2942213 RepID=A0ABT0PCR9_9GAMM|nr:aspartate ammonia-lyase [Sansalvadorimonas sp. 2012CJ34-2]MCL6269169.1 aspartate ammonia-lyase [Sansalvadorimonas sp. 2012CJ34-2]